MSSFSMEHQHELLLPFMVILVTMIVIERHLRDKMSSRVGWRSVHTSKLQGAEYVQELLNEKGGSTRILQSLGVDKAEFRFFLKELREFGGLVHRKYVSTEEQLAIFLACMHKGFSNRVLQERFQRSGWTISVIFHEVLQCFMRLSERWVTDPTPRYQRGVLSDDSINPFFIHCVGAIDGTHIPVVVKISDSELCRNRKSRVTQNCMMMVDFDSRFRYVMTGWEGSAHDGRVLRDAQKQGFSIPLGKFVLADAGYALESTVLTPYKRVIYHISAWGRGKRRRAPKSAKELFNLCHAHARNVVERTYDIVKSKWQILKEIPRFDADIQASIILAACIMHNMRLPPVEPVHQGPLEGDHLNIADFSPRKHLNMDKFRQFLTEQLWIRYKRCPETFSSIGCNN